MDRGARRRLVLIGICAEPTRSALTLAIRLYVNSRTSPQPRAAALRLGPRKARADRHSKGPSMRTNKAILDEAARSVRRTFIGSVAGTVGMFAVVGAAGAYGMPENLTAQALSAAMAKLNFRFPREPVQAAAVVVVAQLVPKTQRPAPQASQMPQASQASRRRLPRRRLRPPVVAPPTAVAARASVPELPPIVSAAEPADRKLAPRRCRMPRRPHADRSADGVQGAEVAASVMPRALPDVAEPSPPIPAPV